MSVLFSIIVILASILLTLLVFVQNPKGGGLSSDFGAAQQLGGVQKTNDFVVKGTWTLASIIMIFSILMTLQINASRPKAPEQPTQTEQTQNGGGTNNGGQQP
jgi:preprotein translocase subunit SecG